MRAQPCDDGERADEAAQADEHRGRPPRAAGLERCFDETARAHHVLPGLNAHMGDEVELREHAAILDAVADQDPEAAAAAMAAHLRTIRHVTLRHGSRPDSLWG